MCFVSAGGKIIGADKLGDLQGSASLLDVFKQVKSLFEDDQVERFLVQLVVGNSRSGSNRYYSKSQLRDNHLSILPTRTLQTPSAFANRAQLSAAATHRNTYAGEMLVTHDATRTAHILLGHKGIDMPKISAIELLDPILRTDIESFLRNEMTWFQAAQNAKWEYTMNDWKLEKVKLMNALIGMSQNWIKLIQQAKRYLENRYNLFMQTVLRNICEMQNAVEFQAS
ncbi:hypothetical protein pipiens_003654 [Culex pipiens pipiens]|uniref:Uncharacterized protein n=1 Tax=Culex pipiens pipiens TaxID=38569 RepID=A0ABD1CWI3_CULPP